jgi:hypothetical protein
MTSRTAGHVGVMKFIITIIVIAVVLYVVFMLVKRRR